MELRPNMDHLEESLKAEKSCEVMKSMDRGWEDSKEIDEMLYCKQKQTIDDQVRFEVRLYCGPLIVYVTVESRVYRRG